MTDKLIEPVLRTYFQERVVIKMENTCIIMENFWLNHSEAWLKDIPSVSLLLSSVTCPRNYRK